MRRIFNPHEIAKALISIGVMGVILAASPVFAQTLFKVIPSEGTNISITMPAGTIYRIGSGTCWSANLTAKAITYTPFSFSTPNNFGIADPCSGVVKELDVLETTAAQTVTVTTSGVAVKVLIPALAGAPAPPASPAVYTITCSNVPIPIPLPVTITMTCTAVKQ